MRSVWLAIVLAACGASAPPPEVPPDPGRPAGSEPVPENCPYRVSDACYDTSDAACAAAGCEPDRCRILESYPAQIRCD